MTERRAVLILNPNAGRGGAGAAREVEEFVGRLRGRGVSVEVRPTEGPDDASRLASEAVAAGATDVVVRGGVGAAHGLARGDGERAGASVRYLFGGRGGGGSFPARQLVAHLSGPSLRRADGRAPLLLHAGGGGAGRFGRPTRAPAPEASRGRGGVLVRGTRTGRAWGAAGVHGRD